MIRTIPSRGRLIVMLALGSALMLSPAPAPAASKIRTGTMLKSADASVDCTVLAECAIFRSLRCSAAGPQIDPRPGDPTLADVPVINFRTPLSGSWANGFEVSILDVESFLNPSIPFTFASSKVEQYRDSGATPNFGHIFFDSQCTRLAGTSTSTAFSFRSPFTIKVPRGTKWIVGSVFGSFAQGLTWTLTFS